MKKKIVSLMLATTLCASMSLTAFAAETAPAQKEVETEGSVNYVDTTVYEVTLPTDGCFNFTVDPQGILSATDPTNYGEAKYPDGTAGLIVAPEKSGAYINNKSSVPIKLTVEAYVAQDSDGTASSLNLLDFSQWDYVNSGIDNNMLLSLDITNDDMDVTTFTDGTSIETGEFLNQYVFDITKNGKPDSDSGEKGSQITFALDKAAYEFKNDSGVTYELKAGETGDSVGMRLSGLVNTNADWKAYAGDSAEKIIVKTVFAFNALSSEYEAAALDGRAHGVLEDRTPEYYAGLAYDEESGDVTGPVAGEMDYVVGQGALEIPFDFGTGANEVTIQGITVNDVDVAETDYKVINSVITFKSTEANVAAAMDAATAEGVAATVVITTSDDMTTPITVTMYIAE